MSATITLDVFSGRPNPSWELTHAQMQELEARVTAMENYLGEIVQQPGKLGYRGFQITGPQLPSDWRICDNIVSRTGSTNKVDVGRSLEMWLLSTAPLSPETRQAIQQDMLSH